jgi:hypothetical protein
MLGEQSHAGPDRRLVCDIDCPANCIPPAALYFVGLFCSAALADLGNLAKLYADQKVA